MNPSTIRGKCPSIILHFILVMCTAHVLLLVVRYLMRTVNLVSRDDIHAPGGTKNKTSGVETRPHHTIVFWRIVDGTHMHLEEPWVEG